MKKGKGDPPSLLLILLLLIAATALIFNNSGFSLDPLCRISVIPLSSQGCPVPQPVNYYYSSLGDPGFNASPCTAFPCGSPWSMSSYTVCPGNSNSVQWTGSIYSKTGVVYGSADSRSPSSCSLVGFNVNYRGDGRGYWNFPQANGLDVSSRGLGVPVQDTSMFYESSFNMVSFDRPLSASSYGQIYLNFWIHWPQGTTNGFTDADFFIGLMTTSCVLAGSCFDPTNGGVLSPAGYPGVKIAQVRVGMLPVTAGKWTGVITGPGQLYTSFRNGLCNPSFGGCLDLAGGYITGFIIGLEAGNGVVDTAAWNSFDFSCCASRTPDKVGTLGY